MLAPGYMVTRLTLVLLYTGLALARPALAQQAVTLQQAVDAALARVPRLALARADTAVARAELRSASTYQNPVLTASHSQAVPRYHATLDIPIDYPWLRSARIGAAAASRDAALYRLAFEQASVRFDAETTYTRAMAAAGRARISRRDAIDADSLLGIARRRRDAGDASELDVRLAAISAGQLGNAAMSDSLASVLTLLDLQRLMGLPTDHVTISLADTLALPEVTHATTVAATLPVRAARSDLLAAQRSLTLERRSRFGVPTFQAGVEGGDPTGAEPGALPLFGISLPLPLFNQNGATVALAAASVDRARAQVAVATLEVEAELARAERELAVAVDRTRRDAALLESADDVARMSLTAYREGAAGLANVLEAQRNARAVRLQYLDDLAAAQTASAAVRLHAAGSTEP
jgi:cobalt-zinc-cadmium efflux system outer membrane protein